MWNTKEDVLNDLAAYTGFRSNFDNYVVRGNRPPPARVVDDVDYDELDVRFGGLRTREPVSRFSGPDLAGISKMLEMVKTQEDPSRTTQCSPTKTKRLSPTKHQSWRDKNTSPRNNVIEISKLNPDVPEFVPKSAAAGNFNTSYKNEKAAIDTNEETAATKEQIDKPLANDINTETTVNNTASKEQIENPLANDINTKTTANNTASSSENQEIMKKVLSEEEKLVIELKKKIATDGKTLEQKREKNVAIAALLRLKTGTPTSASSINSSPKHGSPVPKAESPNATGVPKVSPPPKLPTPPLKLTPPDYFAVPKPAPTIVDVDENEHSIPEPKPLLEPVLKPCSPYDMCPEYKESVRKVMNWQEKAVAKPPLIPNLDGTVEFKKKQPSSGSGTPKSEVSKSSEEIPPALPQEYVPSPYALELQKQYEERAKARRANEEKIKSGKKLEDFGISFTYSLRGSDSHGL